MGLPESCGSDIVVTNKNIISEIISPDVNVKLLYQLLRSYYLYLRTWFEELFVLLKPSSYHISPHTHLEKKEENIIKILNLRKIYSLVSVESK
jgi:hypothetical protein